MMHASGQTSEYVIFNCMVKYDIFYVIWLFEVLWGQTTLQLLVIPSSASGAPNLASKNEIPRGACAERSEVLGTSSS